MTRIILFTDEFGGTHQVEKKDCTDENIGHWEEVYGDKIIPSKRDELRAQKEKNELEAL